MKLLNEKEVVVTKQEVEAFLPEQEEQQIFQPQKVILKKNRGFITALFPFETLQIDIFIMTNFVNSYKGTPFKYALCAIDVFTRKAWGVPMKNKDITSTTAAVLSIIEELNPTDSTDNLPKAIMSDQDSAFLGGVFQDQLDKYQITSNTYIKGDHNALGIIDSFAKRIKLAIAKYIVRNNNKITWDHVMKIVIDNYNATPHESLDGIAPNDATTSKNQERIFAINLEKPMGKQEASDLSPGDKVRISKEKTAFSKSSIPQFSNEIYSVVNASGSVIELSNGKTYKRNSVLKVTNSAAPILVNPIDENITKKNVDKEMRQLGQEHADIDVNQPRQKRSTAGKRK